MGICGNPPHALAFSDIAFWISGAIVTNMRFCSRIFVILLALALILSGTIQVSYASAAMALADMSRVIDAHGDGCDDCGSEKADRMSGGSGQGVAGKVESGGRRITKKNNDS